MSDTSYECYYCAQPVTEGQVVQFPVPGPMPAAGDLVMTLAEAIEQVQAQPPQWGLAYAHRACAEGARAYA